MIMQTSPYGLSTELPLSHVEALTRTRAALAAEGFGIITEIDLAATFAAKLGVAMAPYVILGACNPTLAHKAITADPEIGLLLPCNVVVRASTQPGWSVVSAMDPVAALSLARNDGIAPLAEEVRVRLERALSTLEQE